MTSVYGLSRYSRFIVRRERVVSLIWIVCMVGFSAVFAAMYPSLFPTKTDMLTMAATMDTPAMVAMMGPVYGLEKINPAIIMAQECLIWTMIPAAVMNIFFVNRHTRRDEERGRLEIFRALPVGRLTNAASAIGCAFLLNLVISLLTAAGLLAVNIEGTTAAGAFVYGFSVGAVGFFFAALTLLTAQLFTTSRGTLGWAFAALGAFYILRASGDMAENALAYISPLGLGLRVFAFYEDNFLPVAVLLAEAAVIGAAALAVCAKRDIGEGVVPARPGRKNASRFLRTPMGLAWRLLRGNAFAWAAAAFMLGAAYGSVVGEMDRFLESNAMMKQMLEAGGAGNSLIDNFVAMICSVMSMIVAIPVISAVMKIRAEEKRGRLEQIFSKAVPRGKMFGCYILIAFLESAAMLFLLALGLYAASAPTGLLQAGTVFKAAFVYLPAQWAMIGLSALLAGLLPRLTALIWAMFAYSFLMVYFGRLLDLPEWCAKLSPFGNIPQLPVQAFNAAPPAVLIVIAAALTMIGLKAFGRRDIG